MIHQTSDKTIKVHTLTYIMVGCTHSARLLGRVQGVVVQATRAVPSGSLMMGKDT